MQKPIKDKDTTVIFRCEILKCPFRIVFSHTSLGYALSSYELCHSHRIGDSEAFEFRSMIKEVEEHTEFVYQEYFIQRINRENGSIVFSRPCLILDDLLLKKKLDVHNLSSNYQQRIQLKKKFDNVIQVLRKRFRKEFPNLQHIEDEFSKNKSGSGCSSTSSPPQVDQQKTKNISQKILSLSKTSHQLILKLPKSIEARRFNASSSLIQRDSHHAINFMRKDSTTEPENQLRIEPSTKINYTLDSQEATTLNFSSDQLVSPTKVNQKLHPTLQEPSLLSSHDTQLATKPLSLPYDTSSQQCQTEILKQISFPLIKLFPTQRVPEIDSAEKLCSNNHPLHSLHVDCQQASVNEPVISSFISESPPIVFPSRILQHSIPSKDNENSLKEWKYINWFLLNRSNHL